MLLATMADDLAIPAYARVCDLSRQTIQRYSRQLLLAGFGAAAQVCPIAPVAMVS